MGLPRWVEDDASANAPTVIDPRAATPKRADPPNNCKNQIATNAPTESWVRTVMMTSGQCGDSGLTRQKSAFLRSGGSFFGRVIRVVEMLSSAEGSPGAFALREYSVLHSAVLTISIRIAPSGQAFTHAGSRPWISRP